MKIEEAIEIVERGQRWRRGEEIEMVEPKLFGEAIDMIVQSVKIDMEFKKIFRSLLVHPEYISQIKIPKI